jgi:hypothetical protein
VIAEFLVEPLAYFGLSLDDRLDRVSIPRYLHIILHKDGDNLRAPGLLESSTVTESGPVNAPNPCMISPFKTVLAPNKADNGDGREGLHALAY